MRQWIRLAHLVAIILAPLALASCAGYGGNINEPPEDQGGGTLEEPD
jgi:hypothetical protein